MKRLTALGLLFILLFNTGGHTLLFKYLIYQSDARVEQKISHNDYNRIDLVEIKVPVHLPAVVNWEDYEQIQGQMQFKDRSYNYVGLKITRDTMFLLCLPNQEKNHLVDENNAYDKQVNDTQPSKKAQGLLKSSFQMLKYNFEAVRFHFINPVSYVEDTKTLFLFFIDEPFITTQSQPPDTRV